MAQEDEMTLPYLVFRTWRNYYDKLLEAYNSIKDGDYELGRTQILHAREDLLKSKERLRQRGMAQDDQWMSSVSIMLLNNVVLANALAKEEHERFCEYMSESLKVVKTCRSFAVKELEAGAPASG